ncbi:uncharacterized protein KD926_001625 [Aspergillus affinis]|uniref:uncharacterized protein n=1 Tax=Aspergillus affinis TaxID=1070780 RepID=UPI0022FEBB76|nr:uncharacterized protein KD926_001625 [Aspergillus affinis]KAI9036612.1 hypothetical protein KD926_001625 [Aspergillus affinis]
MLSFPQGSMAPTQPRAVSHPFSHPCPATALYLALTFSVEDKSPIDFFFHFTHYHRNMMTSSSLDQYQIGWICSDQIVAAAAQQMLDEEYGPPDEQEDLDTNNYTLGRVGRHLVVIVCVGGQEHGTTPATATTIHMMRTFPALRTALVISIGGAIPSPENDIRLGDIVVSYPTDALGGILQFDLGRIGDNGTTQHIVYRNQKALLSAVDQMRAAALRNDPLYPVYMTEAIQLTARTQRRFKHPGREHDQLFMVQREHSPAGANCGESLSEVQLERAQREDTEPQTFYGTIASGNALVEHGPARERLGKDTGALCFERVSAGVVQDLPCLAICGISNYADSHKNTQWEGYAALAAAAYAKELLAYVPSRPVPRPSMLAAISATVSREEQSRQSVNAGPKTQDERVRITKTPTFDSEICNETGRTSQPKERLLHTLFDWVE